MSAPLLTLSGVARSFGARRVLAGIDLAIGEGDFVALLGASGCGKSTLLRLIAGLDAPDGGRINWARPPGPGEIGFVFQDANLLPWASALDNVALPLRLAGVGRAERLARAETLLALVGLGGEGGKRPAQLSGGMRMRVAIARALARAPRILLMDEPFAALDEFTRHRLQDDLLGITAGLGCTTVFVTHSLYEAAYLADRIVVMAASPGRIAREIPAEGARPRGRLSPEYLATLAASEAAIAQVRGMG